MYQRHVFCVNDGAVVCMPGLQSVRQGWLDSGLPGNLEIGNFVAEFPFVRDAHEPGNQLCSCAFLLPELGTARPAAERRGSGLRVLFRKQPNFLQPQDL